MEGGAWTLGPRLAIMTAEGDDSENVIQTADIGGLVRFFFNEGKWRFFGSGALGAALLLFLCACQPLWPTWVSPPLPGRVSGPQPTVPALASVPAQMWVSPGADVGLNPSGRCRP